MYRIHKEAWFFTNPRDYLAGAPSDKCENRNECIILDYNTILDKKDVNWKRIYFAKTDVGISHINLILQKALNN